MIQYKGALVLGAIIGAAAGVLLAPDKGSVTRDQLKKEGKKVNLDALGNIGYERGGSEAWLSKANRILKKS